MTDPDRDPEPRTPGASTAEREGIVDQQDAALEAIAEVEEADDDENPMEGEAPTG